MRRWKTTRLLSASSADGSALELLLPNPASKEDDVALRAALRDGHGDETLPGYAARLSEVLGIDM